MHLDVPTTYQITALLDHRHAASVSIYLLGVRGPDGRDRGGDRCSSSCGQSDVDRGRIRLAVTTPPRSALLTRLGAASFAVVSAPAGFGKTSAVRESLDTGADSDVDRVGSDWGARAVA